MKTKFFKTNKMYSALLVAILSIFASSVFAGDFFAVGEKTLRHEGNVGIITRNLDCSSAQYILLSAWVDTTITGDTTGLPDNCNSYGCEPWDESGGEIIFEIETEIPMNLHVTLTSDNDLDLILLSHCSPDSCLGMASSEFVAGIPSGTVFVVVDGYLGASGEFSIAIEATPSGLPQEACDSAMLIEDENFAVDGDLFGQPNLVEASDCASYIERGGEQWYSIILGPHSSINISLTDLYFDGAIWLFQNCGPDAECVGFSDHGILGEDEEISLENLTDDSLSLYIGVDSFVPVTSGSYSLSVSSAVPVTKSSWGSMKSMFR
jgi:hypothetical protein